MRLVMLSDTHSLHHKVENLPAGDVLVHAGDFMNSGYDVEDIVSFNRWLGEQPFKHRVVCAGNHDRYFENAPQTARTLLTNATYLENSGIALDGVTFWGLAIYTSVLELGLHVPTWLRITVLESDSRQSRRAHYTWPSVGSSRSGESR